MLFRTAAPPQRLGRGLRDVVAGHRCLASLDTGRLAVLVFDSLRRLAFPLRLVAARLARRRRAAAARRVGVVAGAAVLAAVLGGRLVMQDRALAQATARLAPGDRKVQVAWSGATDDFARLNRLVVAARRRR